MDVRAPRIGACLFRRPTLAARVEEGRRREREGGAPASPRVAGAAQEEWSGGADGQGGCGAGAGQPPLMDPVADLKLNQLGIVDAVRERQALLQVRSRSGEHCEAERLRCADVPCTDMTCERARHIFQRAGPRWLCHQSG